MKPIIRWALVGVLASSATMALAEPCGSPGAAAPPNCIDCSVAGGCTIYKYGLGHPDNFDFRKPNDPFELTHADFPTGSYFHVRSLLAGTGTGCGPERDFQPIQGQVVLREQTNCVPTAEGPTGPGGCPVEIPLAISGVTHPRDKTTWSNGSLSISPVRTILSSSSAVLGGTSNPANPQCVASNIRNISAQGTRYLLPAARGGNGVRTYIKWRDVPGEGLYRHEDDSEFCCTSPTGTQCGAIGFTEYPVLLVRNCGIPGRIYQLLQTNDWLFQGGKNTPFTTDSEHVIPNQVHGVCRVNRDQACTRAGTNSVCTGNGTPHACCTAAGQGTCGTECNGLDADPVTPGIQADTCDLRERGLRQTIPANQASQFPDPTRCATVLAVLRGTPGQHCTINTKFPTNGDPGQECLIWNFGFRPRPDLNCDGVEDAVAGGGPANDLCPFYNEYDYFRDTDGDCAGGTTRCRGDECECGDQTQNGRVDVSDLVAINIAIFDPNQRLSICDSNNDLACNVSDIVSANREIFVPDSSTCRHITSSLCGDSVVQVGEACDDGARCQGGTSQGALCNAAGANTCTGGGLCQRVGGDGCNAACRVEPGFSCTGSPSVCTRIP